LEGRLLVHCPAAGAVALALHESKLHVQHKMGQRQAGIQA
jgi:hypothetical protein